MQADGKFADNFDFAMVPDGVAQIVVDLPKQGPTRALISNGYYIWGLTGGNSDIKNGPGPRVRRPGQAGVRREEAASTPTSTELTG